jgi:hypothetical protein
MKKLLTTIVVLASFVLAPLAPIAQASVAGTFTATITTPNVSPTILVFPALSGGATSSATTTISIPALSGGIDGTASVSATGTIDVTGTSGTTTSITVGATELLAASSSIAWNTDAATTAADIAGAINANTATSGYAASAVGSTITITAPSSAGASVNGTTATFTSNYLGGATPFSGGVTGTAGVNATTTTSSFAPVTANISADLTLNIGSTTITLTNGMTGTQVATEVAAAINADSGNLYTATVVNTDQVMLTAKASGTAGNGASIATDLDYNGGPASFATSTSGSFVAVASASTSDRLLNIGSTTVTLSAGMTASEAASTTASAVNADPSNPYSATVVNTDQVKLTADVSGTAGNGAVIASDLSYNATAEVATFTPANVTAGETFRATINGTNYEALANASSTVGTIVLALAPLMDANAAVTCTQDGSAVTCTADTAGTAFTASATVLAASFVIDPISFVSDNANTACAKAGDTVTLSFTTNRPLATSTSSVLINGATTTLVSLGGNVYSASTTLNASTIEGNISFVLNAEDTEGNTVTATSTTNSTAIVFDNTAPVIALNGDADMSINFSSTFTDPGASSTDAVGGSITPSVTGSVNTSNPGPYTLTYTATDCAGNTATTTRTVTVGAAPIPGGHRGGGSSSGSSNGIGQVVSAIAQLLSPITTGPATSQFVQAVLGATTFHFNFNLKKGVSSEAVAELQRKLTELGFYNGPITGYFGPITFKGVVKYQKARKISATGFVGPLTRAQLNAE